MEFTYIAFAINVAVCGCLMWAVCKLFLRNETLQTEVRTLDRIRTSVETQSKKYYEECYLLHDELRHFKDPEDKKNLRFWQVLMMLENDPSLEFVRSDHFHDRDSSFMITGNLQSGDGNEFPTDHEDLTESWICLNCTSESIQDTQEES